MSFHCFALRSIMFANNCLSNFARNIDKIVKLIKKLGLIKKKLIFKKLVKWVKIFYSPFTNKSKIAITLS